MSDGLQEELRQEGVEPVVQMEWPSLSFSLMEFLRKEYRTYNTYDVLWWK
jgi:hypothetical protein